MKCKIKDKTMRQYTICDYCEQEIVVTNNMTLLRFCSDLCTQKYKDQYKEEENETNYIK
jgi:ribosomal protein L24E